MTDKMNGNAKLTCLFGSFVFLQFTILGLANHAGEGYLTIGQRELVYYALQVFVILGYLMYSIFVRLCMRSSIRKGITVIIFGLFFAAVTVMLAAGHDSLMNVVVSMMSALCLGSIGGAVHHRMSMETVTGAGVARSMGIGSAIAVLAQYLVQIRWGVTPYLPVFMLAACFLLVFYLMHTSVEAVTEGRQRPEAAAQGRIVFPILIVAVYLLFVCFYNEYIHHLQIQSDYEAYNVYSWPRLMMVPCYLLFAMIGDRKKGKYVPVVSVCITLIALLNVVLTGSPGAYWLNMCFFYCALAAITSYYLLTFWRLAPGTKNPALWAPFGRMLDSGMVLVTGAIHISSFPTPVVLGLDIAGIIVIILLMSVSGSFSFHDSPEGISTGTARYVPAYASVGSMDRTGAVPITELSQIQAPPYVLSEEEALSRMREQFSLTPREAEVLAELVLTEDKQSVISERLSIQVKTLQDYVTKLYRKTGAKTRSGLTELYHKTRIDA